MTDFNDDTITPEFVRGYLAAADDIAEPYPESVFRELSDDELKLASETLQATRSGLCDRLHSGWARHWAMMLRDRVPQSSVMSPRG